ncbi:MAG TPA: hypothetical protein PLP07_02630 [Pyrinomonadaceae bacterium]|nr:hypothetical protein [Chloracidobacterium sp.]MBP9934130.1 hypothetical protein [Pyrinomonadaceae bacterium]MBK7801670.1 hypothetical protein [Chloracidobacterium sp.]MBK9436987.1 hypothetical protein [Chloracidobacterium sp.]MBK9768152.1 hypothetical protein [Chloracidobacterium sp.]
MKPNIPKLIFAILASLYVLWIAYDPMQGSFLDNVDLPIHETGHLLFRPFGEFMMVAGGSLFQVIFPIVFVGYFIWQRSYYSASIVMLWVGQSILNVWVYASDAVVMQLVLTSGFTGSEGSFHDWNYMLSHFGLLDSTKGIVKVIRFVGAITIIAAGAMAVYFSLQPAEQEFEKEL